MRVVAVLSADAKTAADRLAAAGLTLTAFDTGAELEAFVRAGRAVGVLDLRLADLADGTAGPDRLTAASAMGVPQVVAPGGLPPTLTPEAADRLGLDVARKVSAARGPAAVLLPLVGLTPAAAVFNQCVRNWAYGFELVEVELAADSLAAAAVEVLLRLLTRPRLAACPGGGPARTERVGGGRTRVGRPGAVRRPHSTGRPGARAVRAA